MQGLIFISLLVGVLDLCSLPLHLYGHSLSLRFEQSVEPWAPWFWDWAKSELLGIGAAIVMVMILFRVIRWSPRRWWFFFWVAALPILLFIFFISPWFVDPMFNTFHPLSEKNPALAMDIEKVVQRVALHATTDQVRTFRSLRAARATHIARHAPSIDQIGPRRSKQVEIAHPRGDQGPITAPRYLRLSAA